MVNGPLEILSEKDLKNLLITGQITEHNIYKNEFPDYQIDYQVIRNALKKISL
jgi:hypothetical protein